IIWTLKAAGGSEIGTVKQENVVPTGRLDNNWAEIAYDVATAAASGIITLAQGAPSPHGSGAITNGCQTNDRKIWERKKSQFSFCDSICRRACDGDSLGPDTGVWFGPPDVRRSLC